MCVAEVNVLYRRVAVGLAPSTTKEKPRNTLQGLGPWLGQSLGALKGKRFVTTQAPAKYSGVLSFEHAGCQSDEMNFAVTTVGDALPVAVVVQIKVA